MKIRYFSIIIGFFSVSTLLCQVGINTDTVSPGIALEVNGKMKINPISTPTTGAEKIIVVQPDGTLAQTTSGKLGITTVINKNETLVVGTNDYGIHAPLSGINMPFEPQGTVKNWVTTNTFSPVSNGNMRMEIDFRVVTNNELGTTSYNGVLQVITYMYKASDNALVAQTVSSVTCYPCDNGTTRNPRPTILAENISSSETYYLLFSYGILYQSDDPSNRVALNFGNVDIKIYQANEVEL